MADIIVYTKIGCPYCERAMALLDSKGASYKNIEAARNPEIRAEMNAKSGRNTFPQIFINDKHIGGCDDIFALERSGGLDPLLAE